MNRIRRIRRTFTRLVIVTAISFVIFLVWSGVSERDEQFIDSTRGVDCDYSYYYSNVNVGQLMKELPAYATLHKTYDKDSEHHFNQILSDSLPLDRPILDSRDDKCPVLKYRIGPGERKSVSIIITYHNEALSVLLRTIISIIHRTPPDLLNEIILVDDFSEKDFSVILKKLPKIKFIKNDLRLGLIRSRNGAVKQSTTADYVMFLDSHMEVNCGWLEPLLDRIVINKYALVSPVVDIIDPSTLKYKASTLKLKAGFDWSLRFKWIPRSEEEIETITDRSRSFQSPMTYGGVFLIHKEWFNDLGGFNDNLHIWGGESVEISVKAWLCGGQIEIVPCSRIGHIFRKKHPYTFPHGSASETMLRNAKIVADNWLDEYKKFYYLERPQADGTTQVNTSATDIIKDRLQCRSFSWYLQVIFPELKIPNKQNLAYGELQSGQKCLHMNSVGQLEMMDCFVDEHVTTWELQNATQHLSASGGCLTAYADLTRVGLEFCKVDMVDNPAQRWTRRGGNLINQGTKMCLENIGRTIGMSSCRHRANTQLWQFAVEIEQRREK